MESDIVVVLCATPSEEVAVNLGKQLVAAKLVACVNIIPKVRSVYRWQGVVHDEGEAQMVMKTTRGRFDELRRVLAEAHPYEVPEIVALDVLDGHAPYLDWVRAETKV